MKKIKKLISLFAIAVTFTACSGGGGGASSGPGPVAATFTKTVSLGNNGILAVPFDSQDAFSHVQALYQAGDVGGSGNIGALAFHLAGPLSSPVTCAGMTIKLGHTSRTNLGDAGYAMSLNAEEGRGSLVPVIENALVTIPSGTAGDYVKIRLNRTFPYNGVDNLVVDISRTTSCSGDVILAAGENHPLSSPTYTAFVISSNSGAPDIPSAAVTYPPDIGFTFAGGDDNFAPVTNPGVTSATGAPFNTNPSAGRKVQWLYTKEEINGSGAITALGFPVGAATAAQQYTVTVRLGHSLVTDLTATFADNYSGMPVTVAQNATFSVPADVPDGGFLWLPFSDGPFMYNGTDNLIVEVEVTDNSLATGIVWWRMDGPFTRNAMLAGDLQAASGVVYPYAGYARFRFKGGAMEVHTPSGMSSGSGYLFPFYNTSGKLQLLYRAAELGSKGTIDKMACRSSMDTTGGAFTYQVYLSHSVSSKLTSTVFSDNLPAPVKVYDGTFTLPAAKKGDWLEIPLTTPFAYNGIDNLVTQISGTGDASIAACIKDSVTPWYSSRMLSGASATAVNGAVASVLFDMRFTIQ